MAFDSLLNDAREVLHRTFGHQDFRGLQGDVIAEVLQGRSALAVLPTGGGKSLCYQIPSLIRPGLGLVVSPLIALMSDQVAGLLQQGVSAARLDSNATPDERRDTWRRIEAGQLDLLYVSPEGLMQSGVLDRLANRPIAVVAIDEAHCVSQWGHDFRPDYRLLGRLAEIFPNTPRLAVTATADARTREDIRNELRLGASKEFVDSFSRPELHLSAERKNGPAHARVQALVEARSGQSGVIYVGSRAGADQLAERLCIAGAPALAYHAGLDKRVRHDRLTAFLQEESSVMVATIAFGMGIDKPNVRFVVHADPPSSIEAYWQEIGRAGRDGYPAQGITLYGGSDVSWALRRIDERDIAPAVKQVQIRKVRQLYAMLDGTTCRAAAVRRYFGEEGVQPCGRCDLCLRPPKARDVTRAAQMALSAAHRLGGRVGRGRVIDHLLGRTKDVGAEEAALSTFGVGQDLTALDWRSLLDTLLFEGLLREDANDGRPLVGLGDVDAVREVYRGERSVQVMDTAMSKKTRGARPAAPENIELSTPETRALFEALRHWRKTEALTQTVPPYVIFPDRTLLEIARIRPTTRSILSEVSGVGQNKLQRYGAAVLELVRDAGQ